MSETVPTGAAPLPTSDEAASPATALRAGALGLPAILMQGVAFLAPALTLWFPLQLITGFAGIAVPWAFLATAVLMLLLGIVFVQLAREMPSAGGYFTYVSRGIHPRAGFFTSWLYFLYAPMAAPFALAFLGTVLEAELKAEYGFRLPWWVVVVAGASLLLYVGYRGIEVSARALIVFSVLELAIVMGLSIWGLFEPGQGGFSAAPFNPAEAPSTNGLYLAIVFTIFSFTGWDSAAPLAEESENPRTNVPRAVLGAIGIMAVFYLVSSWGLIVGWGTDKIDSLATSPELPPFVLARAYWGGAWVLCLFALVNSVLAASIAANNTATRMTYAMARAGALPRSLAHVHPRFRTPTNAVLMQIVVLVVVSLGFGAWIGGDQAFLVWGLVLTLAMVLIYSAGNLAAFLFYRRERAWEFSWLKHAVLPIVTSAALVWVAYKSVNPLPAAPIKWAPLVFGLWVVLGLAVMLYMRATGREDYLIKAGASAQGQPDAPAELATRPLV